MEKAKGSESLVIAGREVSDLFELNLSWIQLTVKEKDQLLSSLESQYPKLIERAFKESPEAAVIVLSKGKVIEAYGEFISPEEIRRLEEEHGAICIPIVNQRKFMIEESIWSDLTAEREGDYYPTLPINLEVKAYPRVLPWVVEAARILRAGLAGPGQGIEYHGTREYIPGDPMRLVEWKATARLSRLMVKECLEELSSSPHIIYDGRAPGPITADELAEIFLSSIVGAASTGAPIGLTIRSGEA